MRSLCLVLGLLFLCPLSSAQDFIIENYHIDLKVDADGVITISEIIDVDFSEQRRGIIREIPLRYKDGEDRINILIDDIDVVGKDYQTRRSDTHLEIRIGNPDVFITGHEQYIITFKVQGAFLCLEDWTEFKWEIIGSEWGGPINNWDFRLEFSDEFNGALGSAILHAGPVDHQSDIQEFTQEDLVFSAASKQGLTLGEGVTLAVQISPDIISKPDKRVIKEIHPTFSRDFTSPVAALFACLLFFWWQRSKKNYEVHEGVDQYYPPEGLSPAECGAIEYPYHVHRNLISLVPYWGENGFVSVRSLQKKYGFERDDLYLEKLRELPISSPEYETLVFDQILRMVI